MSSGAGTSARLALPLRRDRLLTAVIALAAAGGVATLASSGLEHRGPSTDPGAWRTGIGFADPPVVKGARGGKETTVTLPYFGDPTVRKGAHGSR